MREKPTDALRPPASGAADRAARVAEQSARIAERSLMAAERPLLMSSRLQDPEQKIQFLEGRVLIVDGGAATLEVADGVVYMVISVRNVGTGLAVMHGWHVENHPPGAGCPAWA